MRDAGILSIYSLTNVAEAGRMPTQKLVKIASAFYDERTVGVTRAYAALGAKQQIDKLVDNAMEAFYKIRAMKAIQKKPSTSELLDWIQALMISGVNVDDLYERMPFVGVLLKKNQDLDSFEEIKTKGYSLRNW